MKIPGFSFLQPLLNQNMIQATSRGQHQSSRLQTLDLRTPRETSVFSPRVSAAIEVASFTIAIAAITLGAVYGSGFFMAIGFIAFTAPFIAACFTSKGIY